MRILLAEDERSLSRAVIALLEKNNYSADAVYDGQEALELLEEQDYDAVVLDVLMPRLDGFGVCRAVRRQSSVPILFLTALGGEEETLRGYALGADDYVTKPFSLAVLLAKLQALIRRSRGERKAGILSCGAIQVDTGARRCTAAGQEIKLSPREYELLLCLLRNQGQVLSRAQLLDKVWGLDFEGDDRAVDVRVRSLRAALGKAGKQIKTVFKAGYRLEEG